MPIDVPGLVSATDLHATVDGIAEWQLAVRDDPVVPRRPRRPVEPRRGGHGPRPRRPPRRGRAGLRVARRPPARRRLLAPVLLAATTAHRGRAGQARRQRVRLHRRRRVAPLAAHRRPRLRRDHVADRRAGHRLRARPADAPRRDPLGPPRRRHAVELRPAHRLVVDLPQPALRHRHRRAARPRAPRLGALGRPPGPRHPRRCPRPSPPSTAGRWTGTTRCSAAWCSARPAGPASTSAATPS